MGLETATLLVAALGAQAAGTGMQMYGQRQQGKAAMQAAEYNNRLLQAEARNKELETHEAIKRQRESNRSTLSSMRNQLASSGFVSDLGSSLLLQGETAGRMELAIQDAARSANMQATSLRAKGAMALWEGKQTKYASNLSAIATGIEGVGKMAQTAYTGKTQGTF